MRGAGLFLLLLGYWRVQGQPCGGRWHLHWHKIGQASLQCMNTGAALNSAADPDPIDAVVTVKDGDHRHH